MNSSLLNFPIKKYLLNTTLIKLKIQPIHIHFIQYNQFHNNNNNQSNECPYKILGITKDTSFSKVKEIYFLKCKQFHPDRNQEDKIENQKKLVKIIQAYQLIKKQQSQPLLNKKNNNHYNYTNIYKAGPYKEHFQNNYSFTNGLNTKPIYGTNEKVVIAILLFIFCGLFIQHWRFKQLYGSILEMRERQFQLSAEAYYKVLELANLLGTKERLNLFLEQYNKGRK